jgi:hypothetical protein
VRVQTSTGWQDIGGGAGAIVDIDSPGNSVIITNPGGPVVEIDVNPDAFVSTDFDIYGFDATPQLIDRMVTNDFAGVPMWQLKYITIGTLPIAGQANGVLAATQVTGITESSGPTALDIGAISDGQTLVRSGTSVIGASTGIPTGNPYIDPPLVANAFDDEFNSGSPDLAVRGWLIKNTSFVTLTRSGDVNPGSSTGPAAGTYWSSLMGSTLFVMIPYGTYAYMFKSLGTPAVGDTYFCRYSIQGRRIDLATVNAFQDVCGVYANNGSAFPDDNNRIFIHTANTAVANQSKVEFFRVLAGAFAGATINTVATDNIGDIRGVRILTGAAATVFTADSRNGLEADYPLTGTITVANMAYFAMYLMSAQQPTLGLGQPYMHAVDFVRKTTTGTIAQAPKPVAWNAGTPTGNPYIDPPVTAGSIDDEFETGSADLATRGWIIRNASAGNAVMSRIGDVNPYDTTLTSLQYRSTLSGSQLLIQVPHNSDVQVYKAFTTTGGYVWLRGGAPLSLNSRGAITKSLTCTVWGTAGGVEDLNNRVYAAWNNETAANGYTVVSATRATAGVYTAVNTPQQAYTHIPEIMGIRASSTNTYKGLFLSATGNNTSVEVASGAINLSAITYAGFSLWTPTGTGSTTDTQIFTIDFVRSLQGSTNWIAQTPRPVAWNVINADISASYSSQPGIPSPGDYIVVQQGADGALRRANFNQAAKVWGGTSALMLSAPQYSLADPFNDEFIDGPADLTLRTNVTAPLSTTSSVGWTVVNQAGTTQTWVGGISPYVAPNTLAANTYRASITRAGLLMQTNGETWVYRACTGAFCLQCDMTPSRPATTTTYWCAGPEVWDATTPVLNNTLKRFYCENYNSTRSYIQMTTNQVYTNLLSGVGVNSSSANIDMTSAATPAQSVSFWNPYSAQMTATYAASPLAFVPRTGGFSVYTNSALNQVWVQVRFIRKYAQGIYPGGNGF